MIGAFVGLERQARLEVGSQFDGGEGEPDEPPTEAATAASSEDPSPTSASSAVSEGPSPTAASTDPPGEQKTTPDFEQVAGVRTFSILALLGALATLAGPDWVFPVTLGVVGLFLTVGYALSSRHGGDWGMTSELAALTVFLLGGLCGEGRLLLAAAPALALAVLLSFKQRIHSFASQLRRRDAEAVLKFAALSLVVLPLLPTEPIALWPSSPEGKASVAAVSTEAGSSKTAGADESTPALAKTGLAEGGSSIATSDSSVVALGQKPSGPWWKNLTLDLRKVWWMVILISSVSFAGFVLGKLLGTERGLLVTALIGGLVSSTAVTLTYAQRSRETPALSNQLLTGILAANVIMPLRVVVVLLIVAPALAVRVAIPMLCTAAVGCLAALVLRLRQTRSDSGESVELKNPFELGPALKFGALFALVLLLAQIASAVFGEAGLYALAVISGLTDVDAIVLACADLVGRGEIQALIGASMVTLAVVSNTAVKGGVLIATGARELRLRAVLAFGGMFLGAGVGLALAWRLFAG
ncbi:MAG: DUF4010 domain-containing protein [Planctomycetes bacterium]|nr:DUF4010 domain-containing protein [Planctomycetota bacterium]